MNMFMREALDIVAYLERHGYTAEVDTDRSQIVVKDPVMTLTPKGGQRTDYTDVRFNGWEFAIRFVEVRS